MQNTSDPETKYYQQQPTVGENKPHSSEERNEEEVLEVDRTHIEECTQMHHKVTPYMKSSRLYGSSIAHSATKAAAVGFNIHKGKCKILRYNITYNNRITFDGKDLEDVESFTYLDSIIGEHGGYDAGLKARIGKTRQAYLQLKNIWESKQLSTNTKVRIFNTNVKTVLLYGAETW
ncbi:unnamed protein product [Schistosoma margrebowiei]|uniref:Uncharacterized protein n=1 Tax=Schistosoma margrebowiei TaxID=48269 RepID=A0A183M859_9TREM|nr:unnamed protein product [Schistosoma margrebowiei]